MTMQESHSRKSMGMSACDAKARQREQGAARWHGTTRSRSSLAISTAGQRGGALDQWFEATTHTFNPKCASAADEAFCCLLGGPHWPPKRNLRNELSDLVSGRCETRQTCGVTAMPMEGALLQYVDKWLCGTPINSLQVGRAPT